MRRLVLSSAIFLLGVVPLLSTEVQVEVGSSPKPMPTQSARPPQKGTATPQATPTRQSATTSHATPTPATPEELPRYRPALLGTGPGSLINRINTQELISKGQKDGSIMFCCSVKITGEVSSAWTYRGTPESTLLEEELFRCLSQSVFIPAIYNQRVVPVMFFGTVTFSVVNGKPRLRIFANQEAEELKKESDFVGPQPFVGRDSKFEGLHYPDDTSRVPIKGLVELAMKIDAEGNLKELSVVSEEPPLVGFRRAASEDFRVARFIPAFRDGKPTQCSITLPVCYAP